MTSYYNATVDYFDLTSASTTNSSYYVNTPIVSNYTGTMREIEIMVPDVLSPDKKISILLKDGTIINIDDDHNLQINDKDSQVIYKANRVREFNRFINASDLLETFIKDMGEAGARQINILSTPIELFINWLIYKASIQDGDKAIEPQLNSRPKCLLCGRFITTILAVNKFEFCNSNHAALYHNKIMSKE